MSLQEYIKNLQKKPLRQRERIAVVATGVSFAIIFVIWLVSFSEMNSSIPVEDNAPTIDQLKSLKDEAGESKKSIEEMWQNMPSQEDLSGASEQTAPTEESATGSNIGDNGLNAAGNGDSNPSDEIPPLP